MIHKEEKCEDGENSLPSEEFTKTELEEEKREHTCSPLLAYFNVVCVVAGTGTLGLPFALRQGGWISILILALSWTMSIYTGIILIRCLYAGSKHRLTTYKDVATVAFGPIGGWITFAFNTWIVLGAPILYMVLSGDNLNQLCRGTHAELGIVPWIIISCVIVAIPFVLVKSMKEVAIMSAFGALATLVVVVIVLVVAAEDYKHLTTPAQHDSVIWTQFPIALATISFSFGGNVVYPRVEASLKKPKQWPWVLGAGLSTCAVMYLLVAIPGYYIYGTNVKSPIYNSISDGVPRIIAIVLMTLHVLMATPILVTSFSLDIEDMLNISVERLGKLREFFARACLRICIMTFIGIIGSVVPHFDDLMSLIGAFANCALIFVFPVAFYLKLTGIRNKPFYELLWCSLIIILGFVGLIFGTIESIQALVKDFR